MRPSKFQQFRQSAKSAASVEEIRQSTDYADKTDKKTAERTRGKIRPRKFQQFGQSAKSAASVEKIRDSISSLRFQLAPSGRRERCGSLRPFLQARGQKWCSLRLSAAAANE